MTDAFSPFSDEPDPSDDPAEANLTHIRAQTRALAAMAGKEIATRTLERLRAMEARDVDAPDRALLEDMRHELDAVLDTMKQDPPRAQHRFACNALHLFRACKRPTCRKAQCCRGNAVACYRRADVPDDVADWVATLMLAAELPWMMPRGDRAGRLAYESWIAGINAGR